ncbi:ankyrin repeat-containing protein 09 [Orientia tsutsugamushi]|uniref:ankyrin repeat domain-containing protein n=1 Tax=Orientia tsutsugamushi TaxID=784 RepID=UPI0005F958AD|nr:ankyrin repeat domain-containing protein [Orientia tsutsugamushi]KJV74698.1 ankyrin repeat family protein [Orientia tsutsugamushi str. TA763]SPP24183.1 ankyrin repeat-containing protein 09 [Orientia tsutsugamushi]
MGNTALHEAVKSGNIQAVRSLLCENSSLDYVNSSDDVSHNTALHYAVRACNLKIIDILLTHGANPNAKDMYNHTPFHYACSKGNLNVIKTLLKHGADSNAQNRNLDTPFHLAAHHCEFEIIKLLLLKNGANLNVVDTTGITPFSECYTMFMANQDKNKEVMRLLVAEIVKLEHSDVKISEDDLEGFDLNKRLISNSDLLKKFQQECCKEIEKMKSTHVNESSLSVWDIFILQTDKQELIRCSYQHDDITKLMNEFCMYSPFIVKSIVEATGRTKLLQGAAESMDEIFESNHDASQEGHTSWLYLPPELKMMILENLSTNDLIKLQHFDEAEALLKGAYALYEGE